MSRHMNEKAVSSIRPVDGFAEAERAIRCNARGQAHRAGGDRDSFPFGKPRQQRQSAIQEALGLRPVVRRPHSRKPEQRPRTIWRRALFSLKDHRAQVVRHGAF